MITTNTNSRGETQVEQDHDNSLKNELWHSSNIVRKYVVNIIYVLLYMQLLYITTKAFLLVRHDLLSSNYTLISLQSLIFCLIIVFTILSLLFHHYFFTKQYRCLQPPMFYLASSLFVIINGYMIVTSINKFHYLGMYIASYIFICIIVLRHKKQTPAKNVIDDAIDLKHWLENPETPDFWRVIGSEVYARKTLLLASIRSLENADLYGDYFKQPDVLAATDVFVEKAQKLLAERGKILVTLGSITSIIALALLLYAAYEINSKSILSMLPKIDGYDSKVVLTLAIFKASSVGAFLAAAVYFLAYLSFALFHEGLNQFNRRHALRFGRLYVYAKGGDVQFQEMENAFKWHDEFTTAFKGFKAEKMTSSPLQMLLQTPPETIKEFKEVFQLLTDKSAKKDDEPKILRSDR